jgi:hypothetical protein
MTGIVVVASGFTGAFTVTTVTNGANYDFNFEGFTYANNGLYTLTFYLNQGKPAGNTATGTFATYADTAATLAIDSSAVAPVINYVANALSSAFLQASYQVFNLNNFKNGYGYLSFGF